MTGVPRTTVDELIKGNALTQSVALVVEGPTDKLFMENWLAEIDDLPAVSVLSVDRIEVDTAELFRMGLNDGNRSRVLYVAKVTEGARPLVGCVADRDCGHDVQDHKYGNLFWTDYPALESYTLEAETLDYANRLNFAGRLPPGEKLVEQLKPVLRVLFATRLRCPHLKAPDYVAGMKGGGIPQFNAKRALRASPEVEVYYGEELNGLDPREFAYGHDIGELLMAAYANTFRNALGLTKVEAIEAALRSAMFGVGKFKEMALFAGLRSWLKGGV